MKTNNLRILIMVSWALLFFFSPFAQAQVGSVENLIYQGRIASGGAALNAGVTTFEVSIFGGASNCLLYQETFTKDMSNSAGHYSFPIGSGSRTDTLFGGGAPAHSLSDALRNIGTISGLNCGGSSGSFSPALSNDRRFQLRFNAGSGWVSLPSQAIKSAPYAMQAMQVNGYGISNIAKIGGAGASTAMSPAGWAKIMDYSELGNLILGAGGALTCDASRDGGIRYNAGAVEFCNGTTWTALATGGAAISALTGDVTATGTGSVSATINTGAVTSTKIADGAITAVKLNQMSATSGQVLKWNGTAWAPAADDNTSTPTWGAITGKPTTLSGYGITDAMSSTLNSGLVWVGNGSNVATARNLNISDIKSSVSGNFLTASGACAAGSSLSYSSVTDSISCQAESLTTSQVTTALGFTPADTTLVVAKAGDTMTGALNLPSNGLAVGTNQLVVSGASVGVGTATPAATSIMELSSTNKGVLIPRMTTAQRDAIVSPANGLQVYNTTTNSFNFYNGSSWQALGVAGAGISSLTAGTGLTGGTITTSGTIAVDTGTTANKIVQLNASAELPAVSGANLTNLNASNISSGTLAAARLANSGVTAGSYGSATQVPAITVDAYGRVTAVTATTIALPASAITSGTLTVAQGGTGVSTLTGNRMVLVNSAGTALVNDACTSNQLLQYNGTSWACVAATSLGTPNAVVNAGNSYAGTMTVGTNDNNELRFETNGTDKVTILANGNVGVGTTSPTVKLETAGSGSFQNQLTVSNDGVTNTSQLIVSNSFTTGSSSVSLNTPNNSAYIRQSAVSGGDLTINSAGPVKLAGNTATITTGGGDRMFVSAVGQIGVNTLTPSAIFDITSTTSGLLIPRMTTAQRDAISSPANGLQVYNTTTSQLNYYNGSSWQALGVAGAGISSLTAGTGLTGGTITTSGTIAVDTGTTANKIVQLNATAELPAVSGVNLTNLNASNIASGTLAAARLPSSGVTAGSYGSATQVPAVTVDAYGRVTAVTATTIAIPASAITSGTLNISQGGTGAASLTANRMVMVNGTGTALTNDACTVNQLLQYNGTSWGCVAASSLGTANAVVNNGNSYAGTMTVGTNDNNELRFETNGTDKMTVLANGNVGIGTTSPSSLLHIAAPITVGTQIQLDQNNSAAGGTFRIYDSFSARYLSLNQNNSAVGILKVGTDNNSTTVPAMTIQSVSYTDGTSSTTRPPLAIKNGATTNLLVDGTGNVGIGTTSPGAQLDVNGIIRGGYFRGVSGTAAYPDFSFNSGNQAGLFSPGTNIIGLATNGIERFRVDTVGNIGIGTTSPSAILEVSSTTSGLLIPRMTTAQRDAISSPANGLQVYNTTTSQLNYYNGSSWQALGVAGAGISSLTAGTGLTGGTITSSGTIAVDTGTTANKIVQLNATAELPAVSGVNLTNLNASNIVSGTLAAARLPSSGVTAGSYGSATQVPAITVDAYGRVTAVTATTIALPASAITSGTLNISQGGTGAASLTANRMVMVNGTGTALTNDACTVNQVLQYNGTTWACVAASSLGNTNSVVNGGNSFAGIMTVGTNDNNELRFETNGTDKMTVLASGNVGIGTTTPTHTLNVVGSTALVSSIGRRLLTDWTNGADSPRIYAENVADLGIQSQFGSITLTPGNGLVGVASGLRMGDLTGGRGIRQIQNGQTFRFETSNTDVSTHNFVFDQLVNSNTASSFDVRKNGTSQFLISTAGNVGIGTTSPRSRLDIAGGIQIADDTATCDATKVGTIRYNSSTIQFCNGSTWAGMGASASTVLNGGNSFAGVMTLGTNDNNDLKLETNGTDRITVLADGKVGIGMTPVWQALEVNGNIATAFPWGDNYINIAGTNNTTGTAAIQLGAGNGASEKIGRVKTFLTEMQIGTASNNGSIPLHLMTNEQKRLTIDVNGAVGIGTTAPSAMLSVHKSNVSTYGGAETVLSVLRADEGSGADLLVNNTGNNGVGSRVIASRPGVGANALFRANNNFDSAAWDFGLIGSTSSNSFVFRDVANSRNVLTLTQAGNVGIGTTTPGTLLDIKTSDSASIATLENSASTASRPVTFRAVNYAGTFAATSRTSLRLTQSRGSRASPDPVQSGDLLGAVDFSGQNVSGFPDMSNIGASIFAQATEIFSGSAAGTSLTFATAPNGSTTRQNRMFIDQNGNVGIGTTAPASLLSVDGGYSLFNSKSSWSANPTSSATENAFAIGNSVNGNREVNLYNTFRGPTTAFNIRFFDSGGTVITGFSMDGNNGNIGLRSRLSIGEAGQLAANNNVLRVFSDGGAGVVIGATGYANYSGATAPVNGLIVQGNVGIGTTAPSEKLHVVGNLRVQGSTDCTLGAGSGATMCSSDERLKTNITIIPDSLQKILSLRGVSFDWNEKSRAPGKHEIGVIAQDVEKVFPTAVAVQEETGYKMVDYAVLVAPLIESVKTLFGFKLEQDQVNRILASENIALKKEVDELKQRLQRIEERLGK